MSTVKVILNPSSGRGVASGSVSRIVRAFKQAGLVFDLSLTEGPDHAIELAREASNHHFDIVVAAGGDGTVHEVINGLLQAVSKDEPAVKLAVLPLGSGNDFAHMANCPHDLNRAAEAIAAGCIRRIDVGYVTIVCDQHVIKRYFSNNLGIGFEAKATMESYEVTRLRGLALYLVAAIRALRGYKTLHADITCKNDEGREWSRSGRIFMITVGNSPRAGGGFYLTPQAQMDDGYLDVGIIDAIPIWRAVTLLPQILLRRHASDPAVTMKRTTCLEVDCPAGLPVQLDGEVLTQSARTVKVIVEQRRLQVVTAG